MIVVDTSVFIAFVRREPEVDEFRQALLRASRAKMSAGSYLECAIVATGRGLGGRDVLDTWLTARNIAIAPVDAALAQLAADAFARFGRGRHPAGLNYGDCFSYALAKSLRAPLLFKGEDFGKTDIMAALA